MMCIIIFNNKNIFFFFRVNIWQGNFPIKNTEEDGYKSTSPVTLFLQNNYGLHNIVGNVWEWTADWWMTNHLHDRQTNPVHIYNLLIT